MTKSEFDNNVTTWQELIDFCQEHNLNSCDDIYTERQALEIVDSFDNLSDIAWFTRRIHDGYASYFFYSDDGLVSLNDDDFIAWKDATSELYQQKIMFDEEYEEYEFTLDTELFMSVIN